MTKDDRPACRPMRTGHRWRAMAGALLLLAARWAPAVVPPLPPAAQVAFGAFHACALVDAGVYCWGNNGDGELGNNSYRDSGTPVPVLGLGSGVSAIAVGGFHTCALAGGGVKCWGYNADGELGNGSLADSATPKAVTGLTSGVIAIAAGKYHTCAILTAGSIKCWGFNGTGQLGNNSITSTKTGAPSAVSNIASGTTQITAGAAHTCALVAGAVQCWGRNPEGQLNDGSTTERHVPSPSPNLTSGVATLVAAGYHTCAILVSGELRCWGWNGYGQLGNGSQTSTNANPPVTPVGLSSGVTAVSGGYAHTCAVVNGATKCWGYNRHGQIGNNTLTDSSSPQPVSGIAAGATSVAAGTYSSCSQVTVSAVSQLQCWGVNASGQLGQGDKITQLAPLSNNLSSGVDALGQGSSASTACATLGGSAKCWGYGEEGELGNSVSISRSLPQQVTGLSAGVSAIAQGQFHTCAVVNGAAKCWGSNANGQLGNNSTTGTNAPVQVSGLTSGVTAISAGYAYSCAIVGSGVQCWGANPDGELGNGSINESHVPVSVSGLAGTPVAISTGIAHTCALLSDGTIQCWGFNSSGQLGNNSKTATLAGPPVTVQGIAGGATAVSAGAYFTCAIVSAGLKCWGSGAYGSLGNGAEADSLVPVAVSGLGSNVSVVSAGGNHACALVGGAASCWGAGFFGQLGNGLTISRNTPTPVSGLSANVTSLAALDSSTCALVSGAVKCWGADNYGTLGDGRVIRQLVPSIVVSNDVLFRFGFELY